ncbi:MAG: hypothetical protein QXS68_07370 [Candidatus Methanomethylicaceae archaeon]
MQGFRKKLEQLGIDIESAIETANPMLTGILEQVLCYYWELLCNNPDFVSDYNRLITESVEAVQEFTQKWKLPESYKRALIVACLKGLPENPTDIKPHLVGVSVNLQLEPLTLPEWFPFLETAESYTKRVNQLVQEYKSTVKQIYEGEGLYVSPSQYAKWRDSEYQKLIAQMLYARVIEGKRDTEYMHRVPNTILKECSFWLKQLGFPPDTLRRKRGRPPKAKNCENQR